jgi:hypothetical protein
VIEGVYVFVRKIGIFRHALQLQYAAQHDLTECLSIGGERRSA